MSETSAKHYDLAQTPVELIFFSLLKQRFLGTLELTQPAPHAGLRHIYWRGGLPVFTDWASPSDVLGELYVLRRLLQPPQLEEALRQRSGQNERLGQILRKAGWTDDATLSSMLAWQCTRKLRQCFAVRTGKANVIALDHGLGLHDDLRGQVNVLALIWTGVLSCLEPAMMLGKMGERAREKMFLAANAERYLSHFGIGQEEQSAMDGLRRGLVPAEQTIGATNRKTLALLYTLWICEMLQGQDGALVVPPLIATQGPLGAASTDRTSPSKSPVQSGSVPRPKAPPPRPPSATQAKPASPAHAPVAALKPSAVPPAGQATTKPIATSHPVPAKAAPASVPSSANGSHAMPGRSLVDAKKIVAPAVSNVVDKQARAAFETALAAFEEKIGKGAHAFALFDLPTDVERTAVRERWSHIGREFHPDSLASRGLGDLRLRVQRVFAELSAAYSTLSNKEQRELLKTALMLSSKVTTKSSVASQAADIVRQNIQAEASLREADKALKKNHFARALELFEQALQTLAQDADARSGAAWCRYQLAQRTQLAGAAAARELQSVVDDQPKAANAWFYLGQIYSQLGRLEMAVAALEKACAADARLIDAQRHLRVVQNQIVQAKAASKAESADNKSRLGNLFGGTKR